MVQSSTPVVGAETSHAVASNARAICCFNKLSILITNTSKPDRHCLAPIKINLIVIFEMNTKIISKKKTV